MLFTCDDGCAQGGYDAGVFRDQDFDFELFFDGFYQSHVHGAASDYDHVLLQCYPA